LNIDDEINYAASRLGATAWSPAQWGDRNSDSYAVTLPGVEGVVMINTDLIDDSVTAYAYRTVDVPSVSADILPALMREDGESRDPIAEVTVPLPHGDTVGALRTAITDALARILQDMVGTDGIAVALKLLPDTPPHTALAQAVESTAVHLSGFDKAVLDLLPAGQYATFERIEERVQAAGLDLHGPTLHGVLTDLVARGRLVLAYGRGYLRPSPYDTGAILEPKVWANTNAQYERFGRVDFENDEGGTEVTVWVERGPDGPIVHVIEHGFEITVVEE